MIAITEGTVNTIPQGTVESGTLLFENGKLVALGVGEAVPEGQEMINARGKYVVPGLIDAHCHRGDDILTAIRIAEEFGFEITIEHATEGYRIADTLAEKQIPPWRGRTYPLLSNQVRAAGHDPSQSQAAGSGWREGGHTDR